MLHISAPSSLRVPPATPKDDAPDEWVPEALLAPDLVEDWGSGLERVAVAALLDVQQWGTSREYLVQWADGSKVREGVAERRVCGMCRGARGSAAMMRARCAATACTRPICSWWLVSVCSVHTINIVDWRVVDLPDLMTCSN